MARPREFDKATALEAAMGCFWRRGYEATSMRELTASMGISGPSLYNAFGSKRAVFGAALESYLDQSPRARIKRLEATRPPKDAIRQFIAEIIQRSLSDPERRGCLLINSALEVAPHDRELGAVIGGCLAEIEAFFRRSIKAAQKRGSVRTDLVAKDVARLLLGVVLGIRVLARARPERALLEGVARPALALLDQSHGIRDGGRPALPESR